MTFLFQFWAYTTAILFFTIIVAPVSFLLCFLPLKTRIHLVGHLVWKPFARFFLRVSCLATRIIDDRRPLHERNEEGLYIANHQSFIDGPLFITVLPLAPIMKHEVLYIPLVGLALLASGGMRVERKNPHSRLRVFHESCRRIQCGIPVLSFPEGTRSRTGHPKPVSELRKRLIEWAYDNNIRVTPVSLSGTTSVMTRRARLIPHQTLTMTLHAPLYPKNFPSSDAFIESAWRHVEEGTKKEGG